MGFDFQKMDQTTTSHTSTQINPEHKVLKMYKEEFHKASFGEVLLKGESFHSVTKVPAYFE